MFRSNISIKIPRLRQEKKQNGKYLIVGAIIIGQLAQINFGGQKNG